MWIYSVFAFPSFILFTFKLPFPRDVLAWHIEYRTNNLDSTISFPGKFFKPDHLKSWYQRSEQIIQLFFCLKNPYSNFLMIKKCFLLKFPKALGFANIFFFFFWISVLLFLNLSLLLRKYKSQLLLTKCQEVEVGCTDRHGQSFGNFLKSLQDFTLIFRAIVLKLFEVLGLNFENSCDKNWF